MNKIIKIANSPGDHWGVLLKEFDNKLINKETIIFNVQKRIIGCFVIIVFITQNLKINFYTC